jgi:GH24 family phage-related lysozyme (muramidase)
MKNKGWLAAGLVVGLIAGSCASAFAADGIQYIKASINDTFKFEVNGEAKALDDEYELLVYNNRSYLPVRGIGEMLGADIDWNDDTKTIIINNKNTNGNSTDETPSEKPDNTVDTTTYQKLPQSYETDAYRITLTSFSTNVGEDKLSKIYLRLVNQDTNVVRILPSNISITADGKEYNKYLSDVYFYYQDSKLYNTYLNKDEELNSYITLPDDIKNATKIHVEIPVAIDTYLGQTTDIVTFDIDTEAK